MTTAIPLSSVALSGSVAPRPTRRVVAARAADDIFANYTPKNAFFFPGQGAQYLGMAKSLTDAHPTAKDLFDSASSILGYDLLQICTEGPEDKLNTTAISQPAIYVASLAAIEAIKADKGQDYLDSIDVCCGLSLGEYTSLTFAGAMSFEDGVRLVKTRGEAMQAAADLKPSGMASVIGLDSDKVQEMCAAITADVGEDDMVTLANFLCPGNYAVSGGIKGIEAVEARAKADFKAKMAVRLSVAGAFHTSYMAPAAEKLAEALANTTLSAPRIPVISNVDVAPHSDPETIKEILKQQLTGPVMWEKTLVTLKEKGLESGVEVGPGKVIAGIWKRIDRKFPVTNVEA